MATFDTFLEVLQKARLHVEKFGHDEIRSVPSGDLFGFRCPQCSESWVTSRSQFLQDIEVGHQDVVGIIRFITCRPSNIAFLAAMLCQDGKYHRELLFPEEAQSKPVRTRFERILDD